jgi:hypothetical protein
MTVIDMITALHNPMAQYALTFLVAAGTFGVYSMTYTWLSSTIPRLCVRRAAAIGIAKSFAKFASLYANYLWLDDCALLFRVSRVALWLFKH